MNFVLGQGIWEYPLRVTGVSFRLKSILDLLSDDVEVERERSNPIDANAVAVYSIGQGKRIHIGYLPKEVGVKISDRQLPAKGRVVWKTETTQKPGLRVRV